MSVNASRKKTLKPSRRKPATPARKRPATSSRRAAFSADAAADETMNTFVIWANTTYTLQLPTLNDFPAGTMFYQMWSLWVTTADSPSPGVLARATATTSLTVVATISGIVVLEIRQAPPAIAGDSNSLAMQQKPKQRR